MLEATPDKEDGCGDPGCFSDSIQYSGTKEQIEALMKISTECTQFSFKWKTFISMNSRFFNSLKTTVSQLKWIVSSMPWQILPGGLTDMATRLNIGMEI